MYYWTSIRKKCACWFIKFVASINIEISKAFVFCCRFKNFASLWESFFYSYNKWQKKTGLIRVLRKEKARLHIIVTIRISRYRESCDWYNSTIIIRPVCFTFKVRCRWNISFEFYEIQLNSFVCFCDGFEIFLRRIKDF